LNVTGPPEIVLYGASGHANAVKCSLEQNGVAQVVAFIDDFRGGQGLTIDNRPIICFDAWRNQFLDHPCFIAVGNVAAKRRLADKVSAAGGHFCTFHDVPGRSFAEVTVGAGSYVQSPTYVGPNTRIGEHVVVMAMTTIGHDVDIGDCCTICPSSNIGGHVVVQSDVFIGAGSIIINGRVGNPLTIATGATVAAGAVVMKSVPAGVVVMGNPARPLRELARWRGKADPAS
jgi:sugar O-acyltransferase (sialic acid O-acetyltransferase NeuD family)